VVSAYSDYTLVTNYVLIVVALKVITELKETGHFEEMAIDVDEDEHSIEMHLPYLHKVMQRYGTS
jgi:predicted class III extradiol MEMO1 family dioxygenase